MNMYTQNFDDSNKITLCKVCGKRCPPATMWGLPSRSLSNL